MLGTIPNILLSDQRSRKLCIIPNFLVDDVLVSGNQLKAARALAGIGQIDLARLAGVDVNTVRNMEAKGSEQLTSRLNNVLRVQTALEQLGIEFLNHGQPGVRLRAGAHAIPVEELSSENDG